MQSIILIIITMALLIISFIADRKKTLNGLKKSLKMFLNLLPSLLSILVLISIVLYFTPKELLIKLLGRESGAMGMVIAGFIGSISLVPGFIAYPLGGILVENGVSYSVIAIFITTLMMVGILTLPIEKKFFGLKAALLRNIFSLAGAVIIGLSISVLWRFL